MGELGSFSEPAHSTCAVSAPLSRLLPLLLALSAHICTYCAQVLDCAPVRPGLHKMRFLAGRSTPSMLPPPGPLHVVPPPPLPPPLSKCIFACYVHVFACALAHSGSKFTLASHWRRFIRLLSEPAKSIYSVYCLRFFSCVVPAPLSPLLPLCSCICARFYVRVLDSNCECSGPLQRLREIRCTLACSSSLLGLMGD